MSHAISRTPTAVEPLAGVTVICTDKTGMWCQIGRNIRIAETC